MQRSKNLALSFLLGALLVGGALGFTADRVMSHGTDCAAGGNQGGDAGVYCQTAPFCPRGSGSSWTVSSTNAIDDFLILVTPIRPQLDSIKNVARGEIAKLLTPDQLPRYKELIDESNERRRRRESEAVVGSLAVFWVLAWPSIARRPESGLRYHAPPDPSR